ncbi:MAG: hypothetical protein ACFFF4_09965 [Candidatus Thorarchaeota archaeon]
MSEGKAPITINLHDGYGSVRMKRHVNTGYYENAELEVTIPTPADQLSPTIDHLFKVMKEFQERAKKEFSEHLRDMEDEENE